jgi:hypothetical protein
MTGNYGDYWHQQPMPPFSPPGAPTGYPPPRKSRWPWIIGAVVMVVVVAVAVTIIGFVVTRSTDHRAGTVTVIYEVTGTGKAKVRYNDAHDSVSTLTGVDLPWQVEMTLPTTVMPYVSANQASAGPQLACRISSGGTTMNERKSVIGFVYCDSDPAGS